MAKTLNSMEFGNSECNRVKSQEIVFKSEICLKGPKSQISRSLSQRPFRLKDLKILVFRAFSSKTFNFGLSGF